MHSGFRAAYLDSLDLTLDPKPNREPLLSSLPVPSEISSIVFGKEQWRLKKPKRRLDGRLQMLLLKLGRI